MQLISNFELQRVRNAMDEMELMFRINSECDTY